MNCKENLNIQNIHADVFESLAPWFTKISHYENILSQFYEEAKNIEDLMKRTLSLGESNSALIIGSRGCGKSALSDAVLHKMKETGTLDLGIVVKLSGLIQTDDRLALREITRQLNVDGEEVNKFGSFAENLAHILKKLNSGSRDSSMPIVFILDEFDLFCHHKNQTLLYNLFDIAQSAQAPICVIGLTARLDVIELLEKRVKSRFSHRQIYLFCHDSFEKYIETCQILLKVDESKFKYQDMGVAWNDSIDALFKEQDILNILKKQFCLTRNIRTLKSFLIFAASRLNKNEPWLSVDHFRMAENVSDQDSKIVIIQGLSILQLSLMVAMKHLSVIYEGEPFNFEMVYHQYSKLGVKHSSMSSLQRPVVFKAFDQLMGLELIRPLDQTKSYIQKEYRLMQLLVQPKYVDEAITNMPNVPTFLRHWCTSNIIDI